jgi:hypothetical protein
MAHNEQGFAQGFALCKIQVVRSPEGLRAGAKPCSLYGKPEGISVQRFAALRSGDEPIPSLHKYNKNF